MTGQNTSGPFGFIRFRDTRGAALHAGRYTRIVKTLRWLLPVAVVGALVVLVAWPMLRHGTIQTDLEKSLPVPNLVVDNLTLTGVDDQGQPYSLAAQRALQAIGKMDLVDLDQPSGEITLKSGTWMAGRADTGRLDQHDRRLWLGGHVEMFRDDGLRFVSSEVQVDLARALFWSDHPVQIQGDFGVVSGQGLRVLNRGTVVVVIGPATAQIEMKAR